MAHPIENKGHIDCISFKINVLNILPDLCREGSKVFRFPIASTVNLPAPRKSSVFSDQPARLVLPDTPNATAPCPCARIPDREARRFHPNFLNLAIPLTQVLLYVVVHF
jgi:hypothetical protein